MNILPGSKYGSAAWFFIFFHFPDAKKLTFKHVNMECKGDIQGGP